jgi:5-formyltetrahydrofolate cyclo-ligase
MPDKNPTCSRSDIRRALKRQRNSLSRAEIERASRQIAQRFWKSRLLRRKRRIAVYLAMPGEVDCKWIIRGAELRKMRIFAPILFRRRLIFAPLERDSKLRRNRYGVAEPVTATNKLVSGRDLDAVIVPLLGFDANANRIGMGGGYYDRSFAFRRHRGRWRHPLLIGVAYSFQKIANIPVAAWDVPLDFVITEQEQLENL